jgi:type I restriction enzyme R subunit
VLEELASQGVPLGVLQQAVPNGAELDAFDLVIHVAFDHQPLTRRERANKVKKRDVFGKYGEQARVVLEALLEKFADHGVQDIEDAKVLELPPFDRFGSKTEIRRGIFGGVEQYAQAISELEQALYSTPEQKQANQ